VLAVAATVGASLGGAAAFDWNAAYQAASPGDTVQVPAGSYGDVVISGQKPGAACRWGGPYLHGSTSDGVAVEPQNLSGCVHFVPAPGAAVAITNLTIHASAVDVNGFSIGGARDGSTGSLDIQNANCTTAQYTDIVVRNTSAYWLFLKGASYTALVNDVFSPQQSSAHSRIAGCDQAGQHITHVLLDGTTIRDQLWEFAGQHVEGVQWTACDVCTVNGSRFLNLAQYDISFAFGSGGDNSGNHMLIQNSVFDGTCSHQNYPGGCHGPGSANQAINIGCPAGCSSKDWLFRNNSLPMDDNIGCDCSGSTGDLLVTGNIMGGPSPGYVCGVRQGQGFNYDTNVFGVGPSCGVNNVYGKTAAQVYTNAAAYDFTPPPDAPQVDLMPSGFPLVDIQGAARPAGSAGDAGAYEAGGASPPPAPPPPPPPPPAPQPPPLPPPTPLPPAITSVVLNTCAKSTVTMTWAAVPGAAKYLLFLDAKQVSSTKTATTARFGVPCGTHTLGVSWQDAAGTSSPIAARQAP
jgi:hypothetical protein